MVYAAAAADRLGGLLGAIGATGVAVLLAALLARAAWLLPLALVLVGVEYAVSLYGDASTSGAAPVYAAGLLLVGELGYWALESLSARDEPVPVLLRALTIGLSAAAASGLGLLLVFLSDVHVAGGLGIEAVGIAATVVAVAVVAHLARSRLG